MLGDRWIVCEVGWWLIWFEGVGSMGGWVSGVS